MNPPVGLKEKVTKINVIKKGTSNKRDKSQKHSSDQKWLCRSHSPTQYFLVP